MSLEEGAKFTGRIEMDVELPAELSGAASVAAWLSGKVRVGTGKSVCGLVCGSGSEGWSEGVG